MGMVRREILFSSIIQDDQMGTNLSCVLNVPGGRCCMTVLSE